MRKRYFSMKRFGVVSAGLLVILGANISPLFAIKQFGEQFVKTYAEGSDNAEFVKLIEEAKCNVCHINKESKKKRNEYGQALSELLSKKDYPSKRFKSEPEACEKEIEAAFEKVASMETEAGATFAERIEAGLLPGGDVDGKPDAGIGGEGMDADGEWMDLFDGKSLDGWKINESPDSWGIEDGSIVCQGPRSHLFYVGQDKPFKNFHFKAEVKTTPGSNSGIYFHTKYQDDGWPKYGYECQVNITQSDPKKSGGLYSVVDVAEPPAKDDEWYTQEIIVEGRKIVMKINGETLVEYEEEEGKEAHSNDFERRLGEGTFALQAHDPDSKVYFRNIQVKRLD